MGCTFITLEKICTFVEAGGEEEGDGEHGLVPPAHRVLQQQGQAALGLHLEHPLVQPCLGVPQDVWPAPGEARRSSPPHRPTWPSWGTRGAGQARPPRVHTRRLPAPPGRSGRSSWRRRSWQAWAGGGRSLCTWVEGGRGPPGPWAGGGGAAAWPRCRAHRGSPWSLAWEDSSTALTWWRGCRRPGPWRRWWSG